MPDGGGNETGNWVGGEVERTHEQVEHDVGDDDVEGAEVNEGASIVAAVRLPVAMLVRRAERRLHLGTQSSTHSHIQHMKPNQAMQYDHMGNHLGLWPLGPLLSSYNQ